MTWIGVAKLLSLDGSWQDLPSNLATIDQIREWVVEPMPPMAKNKVASQASTSAEWTPRRSDAEYLTLAWSIIRSEKWRTARMKDARGRRRVLSVLIDTALTPCAEADR